MLLTRAGEDPSLAEPAFEVFFAERQRVELYEDALPALERLASRFVGAVKGMTPAVLHRAAKSMMTKEPDRIAEADRAWLTGMFAGENQAMESIAGFRFYR